MQTKRLILCFILIILAMTAISSVSAQQDSDGDHVPDLQDRCPQVTGLRENEGCPALGGDRPAPDRDGDGVADFVDQCPDEVGTGFTNGCPVSFNGNGAAPTPISIPFIAWVSWDYCLVGVPANAATNVNVHAALPSDGGPDVNTIIGVLHPGEMFAAAVHRQDANGQWWYYGALNSGWVAASAVITNGMCDGLPEIVSHFMCVMMVKPDLFDGISASPLPVENFQPEYMHVDPGTILYPDVYMIDANHTLWIAYNYALWVHASDLVDVNQTCFSADAFFPLDPMPDTYYDGYPDNLIGWLHGLGYTDFPLNQGGILYYNIDPTILQYLATPTPGN
ncbi:MAG: hypothetical protein U0670_15690 [Anaerolineae bacterium]